MSLTDSAGARDLTGEITEALVRLVGRDLFRLWYGQISGCEHSDDASVTVFVSAQFAMDRIGSRYMKELRQAVGEVCGEGTAVKLQLAQAQTTAEPPAHAPSQDAPKRPAPKPRLKVVAESQDDSLTDRPEATRKR